MEWVGGWLKNDIEKCRSVDEELLRRYPLMTPAMLNMTYPITPRQRECAESRAKAKVEKQFDAIEAKIASEQQFVGCV